MMYKLEESGGTAVKTVLSAQVYSKVTRRLLPFLFVCNVLNWLDRVNVSFAHLQFKRDLGFSDASFGIGVGIFFVGYILFEVPSNLLMKRVGARLTISRILILWGVISASMMFIRTPTEFYFGRVALGAAEAGFIPGMMLYLTYWYPGARRARIVASLLMATAVSGILGGPISGWIIGHLNDIHGLRGWQWLFLLEGLPALAMGVIALFYLNDGPSKASWLSVDEKFIVNANLAADEKAKTQVAPRSFSHALADPRLYLLAVGYMAVPWSGSVVNFWAPSIIQRSGVDDVWQVGLLSSIPFIVGIACMLLASRHSDRYLERRWHFAISALVAAIGIALLPIASSNEVTSIALLTVATSGYLTAFSLFWAIPPAYLSAPAAAGGIALVSCLGQLGGLSAPMIIGWFGSATKSYAHGMYAVAAVVTAAALAVILGIPAKSLRERHLQD